MALNTVAKATSPHPLKRWMGAATLPVALTSTTLAAFAPRTDQLSPTSYVDRTRVS